MSALATLHDLVEPFVGAVQQLGREASAALENDITSSKIFEQTCQTLIEDKTTFQGLGAQAFSNIFAVNDGTASMLLAKLHDFANASNNLPKEITSLTEEYDALRSTAYFSSASVVSDGSIDIMDQFIPGITALKLLAKLRDGFVSSVAIDGVLSTQTIDATITSALDPVCADYLRQLETAYARKAGPLREEINNLKKRGIAESDIEQSSGYQQLDSLKQDYAACIQIVQTLTKNMHSQLLDWTVAFTTLVDAYTTEIIDASKVTQPTTADIIYQFSLPEYSKVHMLIWQLPDGGLLVAVHGGDSQALDKELHDYLVQNGLAPDTPITILGYENGTSVAQSMITGNPYHFKIINAIMVGDNLPDSGSGSSIDYIMYPRASKEGEKNSDFLGLTSEQWTMMAITTVIGVATMDPAAIVADFTEVFGELATEKLTEYAVDLGYNTAHPEHMTPAEFLAQKLKDNNQSRVRLDNGQVIPLSQYVQQRLNQGNFNPKELGAADQPYSFTYQLPGEPGVDKHYTNSAYLGTQFILDPASMSRLHESAVTTPPGPISPPASEK